MKSAVLPDWWEDDCIDERDLLPDLEVRVARFLSLPTEVIVDPDQNLQLPSYESTKLRRVRDVEEDRLRPAIHLALAVAAATVRNLKRHGSPAELPDSSAAGWRDHMLGDVSSLTLEVVLDDLWSHGIPVIPMQVMPTPSFQGLACIVDNKPVIVLGHKLDAPDRIAFLIAHEVGHLTAGDCEVGQPVVDEDDEVVDDADIEVKADNFARSVMGTDEVRLPDDFTDYKTLARASMELENQTGVGAGSLIFAWASISGNYQMATMAIHALYRGTGAQNLLARYYDDFVDSHTAPDTDRALLSCARSLAAHNAASA